MATSPIVKLAPNVPADVLVKYLDVVSGQYGTQLRIKGAVDGKDATLYLPGNVPDGLTALYQAGALTEWPQISDPLPERGVAVKLAQRHLYLLASQPAGEKYPKLVVQVAPNGGAPATAAPAPPPAAPAGFAPPPAATPPALPAGMPPFPPPAAAAAPGFPPGFPPAVPAAPPTAPPSGPASSGIAAKYLHSLDWVIDHVVPKLAQRGYPPTCADVLASTATVFIQRVRDGV